MSSDTITITKYVEAVLDRFSDGRYDRATMSAELIHVLTAAAAGDDISAHMIAVTRYDDVEE
jgi:hypothetical protein